MHESESWGIDPSLIPFATGVGALCQAWSAVEYEIADTLQFFLGLPNTTATQHIFYCFESRDQIKAIKICAVEHIKNNTALVDALFSCLDYIDNELRTMRNGWVHAEWLGSCRLVRWGLRTPTSFNHPIQSPNCATSSPSAPTMVFRVDRSGDWGT